MLIPTKFLLTPSHPNNKENGASSFLYSRLALTLQKIKTSMRTSSKFLISIVIILLASACSSEKKQQKAIVKQPSLEKAIIGSWTTEGSAEQIDDYMMAGYGQQIIFNNDKTFEMGVMMSISGTMPYETAALPVSATFGAEISGKYAIAGNTVTLTYSADSITGTWIRTT